jgi:Tol biopolymer transport system component
MLIAFSGSESETEQHEVYVVNVDGNGLINLTNHQAEDDFVAWTPDGSQLLFVSDRDVATTSLCKRALYVMDAAGAKVRRLVDNVRYTPDQGTWVPFSESQIVVELDNAWYVLNIECIQTSSEELGSLPEECRTRLPKPSGAMVYSNWPSGGKQFSYAVTIPDTATYNVYAETDDIFVVDFKGTGMTNLTKCPADDIDPDWSP